MNPIRKYNQNDYAPTLMHDEALNFISRNKNSPFFLYYASPIPHLPLQAPTRWVDYYQKSLEKNLPTQENHIIQIKLQELLMLL